FAFLGNIFFPLSGAMLTVAQFTPLYGLVALARYPLTEGMMISTTGPPVEGNGLWIPVLNLVVWTIIFAVTAFLLVRRGRSRQTPGGCAWCPGPAPQPHRRGGPPRPRPPPVRSEPRHDRRRHCPVRCALPMGPLRLADGREL